MSNACQAPSTAREVVLSVLNTAFTQRYSSLARYVLDAVPYVTQDDAGLLQCIQEIAAFDAVESARLAELIESLEGVPQVAPHPHDVAVLNYLALPYLKGILVRDLSNQLALYESRLPLLEGCHAAYYALDGLCRALREQVVKLQAC